MKKVRNKILPRSLGRIRAAAEHCASRALPEALGKASMRRAFARSLVSMRGMPLKMSQILSMSGDAAIAETHRLALAELPPMPVDAVRKILRAESPGLAASIREFSKRGIPASLGQVHRVAMHDGRICALKVRYPGIEPEMALDNGLMDLMLAAFGHFRKGFDVAEYRRIISEELRAELDYPFEAERQARLAGIFPEGGSVVVPRPYPEESGRNHILMTWQPSQPVGEYVGTLRSFGAAGPDAGLAEAGLMADFHLGCLFQAGMVHADPNPGNFGYRTGRNGPELVVYDYGSIMEVSAGIRQCLPDLIRAAAENENDVFPMLIAMGFHGTPLEPIRSRLGSLCRILFEPFLAEGPYDLKDWHRRERVQTLLGAERWNFMVAAPSSLFPIMRAFHGLFHYVGLLGGRVALGPILARRLRGTSPSAAGLPESTRHDRHPFTTPGGNPDTRLRIEIRRGGGKVASLTMPGESAGRLETLIEPELAERIRARGMDPRIASEKARKDGFRAGPLFSWADGDMSADIWLE